jgi:alkaline phosphatase D
MTMPLTLGQDWYQAEFLQDSWDGFQAERHELMQHLRADGPDNFVTLTGDLHCSVAGYMKAGYGEIESGSFDRVGVELLTPAVSSLNAASLVDFSTPWNSELLNDLARLENDHLQFVDWFHNGYAVVTFGESECRYTVYEVDAGTDSSAAERSKLAEFRVPEGEVRLQKEYSTFDENPGSDLF